MLRRCVAEGCAIAVLQGAPARRNADVFFRVPPESELPRHWHSSAERMVLVSGELHLTYDGQNTEIARPGTYVYGPATLPHEGRCAAGDPAFSSSRSRNPSMRHRQRTGDPLTRAR